MEARSASRDGGSESQFTIPEPPPFNDPNYETYKDGQQFMIVDHTANQRNGSEVSKIWQHGGERRRVDDGTMDRHLRCGHCDNKRTLKCPGRGATFDSRVNGQGQRALTAGPKICTLRSQTYSFSTTPHFWLYLPNTEMTLDLKVNEVKVKVLTSFTSVTGITGTVIMPKSLKVRFSHTGNITTSTNNSSAQYPCCLLGSVDIVFSEASTPSHIDISNQSHPF